MPQGNVKSLLHLHDPDGGHDNIKIVERLPHAHEHDIFHRFFKGVPGIEHLARNFVHLQVPFPSHAPGFTERASHAATHLGGHAQGAVPVHGYDDRFDLLTIGKPGDELGQISFLKRVHHLSRYHGNPFFKGLCQGRRYRKFRCRAEAQVSFFKNFPVQGPGMEPALAVIGFKPADHLGQGQCQYVHQKKWIFWVLGSGFWEIYPSGHHLST